MLQSNCVIHLIGRVGGTPESKQLDGDKTVTKISVAVSRKDSKKNETTDWFKCEFWGQTAMFVRDFAKKGELIYVVGSCQLEKWEKDGTQQTSVKILGEAVRLLSTKDVSQVMEKLDKKQENETTSTMPFGDDFEDEIPPF